MGGGGEGFDGMLPLSWVSESFRHDIGQFHSPQMKPCKSANYFIPQFQLGKFIVIVIVIIVTKNIFIVTNLTDFHKMVETGVDPHVPDQD